MPEQKNQHFVPRCHLRKFSPDTRSRYVATYNIRTDRAVQFAAIKSQCAKDYFYGKDKILENAFQPIEGNYASLLKKLSAPWRNIEGEDLKFLRSFAALQYLRSDMAAKRLAFINMLIPEHWKNDPEVAEAVKPITVLQIRQRSVNFFPEAQQMTSDLKDIVIVNESDHDFVTSDDPAVHTNRFQLQRLGKNAFGFRHAGAILLMPLGPRLLFLSYDPNIYTVPDSEGKIVRTRLKSDVLALNQLQYIRSGGNIYFKEWAELDRIKLEIDEVRARRPESWYRITWAIEDQTVEQHTRFRVLDVSETRADDSLLFHAESLNPDPPTWLSKLKWHHKPRYIDTKSGAGVRRPTAIKFGDG